MDTGNTIHIEESATERARGVVNPIPRFARFATSTDSADYSRLLETWTLLDRIEWKEDSDYLFEKTLPYYAYKTRKAYMQMQPFKGYQYWRGDIEIRVTAAGSPFAVGQCQIAWYYDATHDSTYTTLRRNCCARSQMLHTLIDAASSNDATLYIPFRSYRSFLQTRSTRTSQGKPLDMGLLTIAVLNKLRIPNSCTSTVSLIVHVRFPNSTLQGRVSTDLV